MVVMVVIVVMAVMVGMVVMFTFGYRKNVGSQKIESGLACLTSPWPGGGTDPRHVQHVNLVPNSTPRLGWVGVSLSNYTSSSLFGYKPGRPL